MINIFNDYISKIPYEFQENLTQQISEWDDYKLQYQIPYDYQDEMDLNSHSFLNQKQSHETSIDSTKFISIPQVGSILTKKETNFQIIVQQAQSDFKEQQIYQQIHSVIDYGDQNLDIANQPLVNQNPDFQSKDIRKVSEITQTFILQSEQSTTPLEAKQLTDMNSQTKSLEEKK